MLLNMSVRKRTVVFCLLIDGDGLQFRLLYFLIQRFTMCYAFGSFIIVRTILNRSGAATACVIFAGIMMHCPALTT